MSDEILLKRIPIKDYYKLKKGLRILFNRFMESSSYVVDDFERMPQLNNKSHDNDFMSFFLAAIVKELQYLIRSKFNDLSSRNMIHTAFGAVPKNMENKENMDVLNLMRNFANEKENIATGNTINAILNAKAPWKKLVNKNAPLINKRLARMEYIARFVGLSMTVLKESYDSLLAGKLLHFSDKSPKIDDDYTELYLYYRVGDEAAKKPPTYCGHIFVQPNKDPVRFLSIYKSMFEPLSLSSRMIHDIEEDARAKGRFGMMTEPFENMKPILEKNGFVPMGTDTIIDILKTKYGYTNETLRNSNNVKASLKETHGYSNEYFANFKSLNRYYIKLFESTGNTERGGAGAGAGAAASAADAKSTARGGSRRRVWKSRSLRKIRRNNRTRKH